MSLFHRRVVSLASGALVAAGLALVPAASPTSAAEGTTTVSFRDCEVREDPYGLNHRIADNITWTTPVRLNIPSPLRASEEVTIETELGPLPANLLPLDLTDVVVDASVEFGVEGRSDLWFASYGANYGSIDAGAPLELQELEIDTYWPDAGIYVHRPKSVAYLIRGYAGEDYHDYSFECDQLLGADPILTTAVYDTTATPVIQLDTYLAKQGATIGIVGEHLLGAAPTTPAAEATITIDGIVVGSYPIDDSGAISVRVKVPPYAAPGNVQVRASNGARAASAPLQVIAGKGKVTAAPKTAAPGKKVTLKGSRFKPGETVRLVLKGGRGSGRKAFSASVRTRSDGTFTKAVKLKKSATGSWRVVATGATSKRTARSSFKVR